MEFFSQFEIGFAPPFVSFTTALFFSSFSFFSSQDRSGFRGYFTMLATLLLIPAYVGLWESSADIPVYLPLILLGCAYSIAAVGVLLWE